jgi:hypothetical protein
LGTIGVVSSEEELEVVPVAVAMLVAAVWWVLCCASTALSAATPTTLSDARVAVAVLTRRMPSARAVITISLRSESSETDRFGVHRSRLFSPLSTGLNGTVIAPDK